ncbi:hypothetical protein JCM1841_006243 [Sporobolomyces salmonicolor]
MAPTAPSSFTATFQPGKAPILLDTSPAGLTAFSRTAKLFFRTKSVKDDEDKVAYVGAGLSLFPELHNWYLASAVQHEAKTYDSFLLELQRRTLPRDYLWEAKGRLRAAKQGEADYEDWADAMRTEFLSLTDKVVTTREFVEDLLYGMDVELSAVLRRGTALKGTGFHQDDASNIFSTTATAAVAAVDYDTFDHEVRDEWAKIATRRRSNTAQLRSLNKKATSLAVSGTSRSSSSSPSSITPTSRTTTTTTVNATPAGQTHPAKLTDLERDWLNATNGCFKCRKSYVGHEAKDCSSWAPAGFVVAVPPGWDRTKPVPGTSSSSAMTSPAPANTVGIRAVQVFDDDDIDIPDSFADDPDSDTDGCAFPPLSLSLSSSRGSRSILALADSGSSVTLISEQVTEELGLQRYRLSKPKHVRVAIKGDEYAILSEFVRVPIHLENGSWKCSLTTLIVAPLEDPFAVILGVPFLRQNRISLVAYPEPRILVDRGTSLEPLDLLAPVYGPPTAFQVIKDMDDNDEKTALTCQTAAACAVQLEEDICKLTDEEREMKGRADKLAEEFADLFPSSLPPLTADYLSRTSTRHHIKLVDSNKVHNQRGFNILRKWRERWKRMLEEHLAAGRLHPSTSPYASAAFVVPKKDPKADPRWVNDYRHLNSNTVKDRTPLPLPDLVLADAALAKVWGKIDMTNAFFQTPMDEDDIAKTAIKTP